MMWVTTEESNCLGQKKPREEAGSITRLKLGEAPRSQNLGLREDGS